MENSIFSKETMDELRAFTQPIIEEVEEIRAKYQDANEKFRQAFQEHEKAMENLDAEAAIKAKQKYEAYSDIAHVAFEQYNKRRKELGHAKTANQFFECLKQTVMVERDRIEKPLFDEIESLATRFYEIANEIAEKRRVMNKEVREVMNKLINALGGDTALASIFLANHDPCGTPQIRFPSERELKNKK